MFITNRINRSKIEFAGLLKDLSGAIDLHTTDTMLLEHYCHRLRVLLCPEPPQFKGWQANAILPVRFTRETMPVLYRFQVHMESLGLDDSIAPIMDIAKAGQLKQMAWAGELLAQATFADWLDAYYAALEQENTWLLVEALDSLRYYASQIPATDTDDDDCLRAQFTRAEHAEFLESQIVAFNLLGTLESNAAIKPLADLAFLGSLDSEHGFFEGFSGSLEIDAFTDQYFDLAAMNLKTQEDADDWE